jgi:hypothetical protein
MKTLAERPAESDFSIFDFGALRRIGDEGHQKFGWREVNKSAASEKVRRKRSSGQIFGLAATAVFFAMLILNAISY